MDHAQVTTAAKKTSSAIGELLCALGLHWHEREGYSALARCLRCGHIKG